MRACKQLGVLVASLLLFSCTRTILDDGDNHSEHGLSGYLQRENPSLFDGMPPGLMGDGTADSDQPAKQLTATSQEEMTKVDSGAIYFTDAHDPDAPIPGLEDAFALRKENERWIQSYPAALREAQTTGKPVLIWFHHSKSSPPSKKLASELLHTKEFEEWAKNNVVRVCYDQAATFEHEPMFRKRKKMIEYVQKAPKLFGVRGTPVLLVMAADGSKVATIRGYYSGQNIIHFDQIKQNVALAKEQYGTFKKNMSAKGYRIWTGLNGVSLFAKLSRYSDKDQTVWLQEPDGHQNRTTLNRLSKVDRQWLMQEKANADNARHAKSH